MTNQDEEPTAPPAEGTWPEQGPHIKPNKSPEERVEALLDGDVDTEELPVSRKTQSPIVVGIGASAGGLEALTAFFEEMPPDTGMTFVVVTHLSPDHKSVMDELLQRHTAMPVKQVLEEQLTIEPDHVYLIPPNRQLVLADTHLFSQEFEGPRAGRAPIDVFFRSLAAMHANPVAVLLTGGGTDGALGLRSVKEAGGLVMVQDPGEAAYDSMPRAAIATGVVDLVLPVRELARALVELNHRHVKVPSDPTRLTPEQRDALHRILTQLQTRSGHDFRAYKQTTVLRRIQRRMQITGYESLEGYLTYLRHNPDETQSLLGDLLIGVTNFFRDEESWRQLEETVIPELFAGRSRDETIRVWSVGCSTGEEAYSLAILLLEHSAALDAPVPFQIFATDLDEGGLAKAREGFYPDAIAGDVSAERLQRFFTKEGAYYRVRREVRDTIFFAAHSVLRDPPFSRLDLVVCRNLLIYLQRPLQDTVFEVFYYALRPGGYLFLGNSETADGGGDLFLTADKKHRIYRSRAWPGQQPALPSLPLIINNPRRSQALRPIEIEPRMSRQEPVSDRKLYEQTLEEFGPPGILVDDESNVVRISGAAGRYLQYPDGAPTNQLTRLIRPELQFELRSGLFQALEKGVAGVSQPVVMSIDGVDRRVYLSIWRRAVPGEQRLALIVFMEDQAIENRGPGANGDEGETGKLAIRQLEEEVRHLRDRLQAIVEEYETSNEELKAANEELQSINEEYRSTTEELETSKEELQSVNEELETVNSELKNKLDEISRAHSDLQNLMAATEIATLFLDRDLRVENYTDHVDEIFNIVKGDRGRPIEHLTHRLAYPELGDDARTVLRTLVPAEREVARADGTAWYLARLRPYRTLDDRIEGVVLTFINITHLKRTEQEIRRAADALNEAHDNLQLALESAELGWGITNLQTGELEQDARARAIAGLPPEGPLTRDQFLALIHPDDLPRVQAATDKRLSGEDSEPVEFRLIRPDGETRLIRSTGLARRDADGDLWRMTGTLQDITERRREQERLRQLTEELELLVAERTAELRRSNADLLAARDRFQVLFNDNPTPNAILDLADGSYLDVNPAFLDFVGAEREELIGRRASELIFSRRSLESAEELRPALDRGGLPLTLETTFALRPGDVRTALFSAVRLTLDDRPALLAAMIDITELKQAERQIRELASELTRAEEEERRRISSVLHDDLQQRLYAIQIELMQLRKEIGRGDPQALAAKLDEMDALLPETIDVARDLSVDLSPPILQDEGLVEAVHWLGALMNRRYGLTVKVEAAESFPQGDQGLRIVLFQVVRELLFNVVKHAETDEVEVILSRNDDRLEIVVKDGGRGFDAREVASGDPAKGHGLSTARRRLALFGGEMHVESNPDVGTRVVVTAPPGAAGKSA